MSTTTYRPDGSLSMNPNDETKPQTPRVYDDVHIVAVKNGWMVYAGNRHFVEIGASREPNFVFNKVEELLDVVRALLKPDGGNKHLQETGGINAS